MKIPARLSSTRIGNSTRSDAYGNGVFAAVVAAAAAGQARTTGGGENGRYAFGFNVRSHLII